jgi:hypothetical protein
MAYARKRGASPNADSSAVVLPSRTGPHGEAFALIVGNGRGSVAEEGSYFNSINATASTEIAGHAAPAIGDEATKPLVYLYNGGDRYITLDYIHLRTDTPNASSTASYYALSVTAEQSRDSGGTAITPQNCRSDNPLSTGATVYFGAVVCTPSSSRLLARVLARPVIAVAEDSYMFAFGQDARLPGFAVATGTTVTDRLCSLPPCVVAPGGEMLFTLIAPSGASTAWDGEISLGYWER